MALNTDPASPNYGKDVDADFAQVAAQYGILPQRQAAGLGDPTQLSPQGASAEATRLSTPFGQAQQALGTFNAVPDLTSKAIADLDAWRVKTFGDVGATTSPLVTTPVIDASKIQPAQAVTGNAGFTPVVGSEFGEVDRPSRGGYTEPNWNRGAWGDDLTGNDNQGVALPTSLLAKYGYQGQKGFNQQFNANYEVQVRNPQTGQVAVAPLKDIGPGQSTGAQIDLLAGTRGAVGLGSNFKGNVEMRVVPKGTGVAGGQQTTEGQSTTSGQPTTGDLTGPIYIHPVDPSSVKAPSAVPGQQLSTDELTTWARAQTDQYAKALADAGTPMNGDEYKQTFGGFFASGQKINMGILPERLPADQISSLEALDEGNRQIDNVVALLDKFRAAHPQAIAGTKVPNVLDPLVKASDEYKAFDAARSLAMMPLARGVGGMTSRVSDVDLGTIKDALPNEFDTPAQARQKADILKQQALDMMQKKIQYFAASNYDVNRFVPIYQQAAAAFKNSPSQAQQDDTGRTAAQKTAVQQTRANRVAALTRPTPLLPPQPPNQTAQPNIFETQTNEALPPALTGAPTD